MRKQRRKTQKPNAPEQRFPSVVYGKESPKPSGVGFILHWLGATGIALFLVGMGVSSVSAAYFWELVVCAYAGMVLLLVDLWTREISGSRLPKMAVSILILAGGCVYTIFVVLHVDPIGVYVMKENKNVVSVLINNFSRDDYTGLNMRIKAMPREAIIESVEPRSNVEGVTLVQPLPGPLQTDDVVATKDYVNGTRVRIVSNGTNIATGFGVNGMDKEYTANFQRISCATFAKGGMIHLEMHFEFPPTNLVISGEYQGKFRKRNFVQTNDFSSH